MKTLSTGNNVWNQTMVHNPAAVLDVYPTTVIQGNALSFSFSGFQPGASVGVSVVGGGGLNVTADSQGNGQGSLMPPAPGSYTLQASDSYGHHATAGFTVQQAVGGPVFPAPSSDTSWYWVEYKDGSYGWDDVADVTDFYQHDPNNLIMTVLHGPYAPGATG
jgi:hypothetical protein